jgi:hypothetical protein
VRPLLVTREHTYEHSQTRCVHPITVPPSASIERVGEYASEIVVRRATRVCERSSFWGNVLATARSTNADPVLRCRRRSWDCTAYDYIEHTHEMSHVNGATDALSIGPSTGYTLSLVFVHILLLFTAYVTPSFEGKPNTNHVRARIRNSRTQRLHK